ncbi:hypothetical protein D3C73_1242550 [compost metagenome]
MLVRDVVVRQHLHPDLAGAVVFVDDRRLGRMTDAVGASGVTESRNDLEDLHVVIEFDRERRVSEWSLHQGHDPFPAWFLDDHHLGQVTGEHSRTGCGDVPDKRVESVQ